MKVKTEDEEKPQKQFEDKIFQENENQMNEVSSRQTETRKGENLSTGVEAVTQSNVDDTNYLKNCH